MVLDVAALRERLKRSPPAFSVYGDVDSDRAAAVTAAAVLVPIVDRPSGLTVILPPRTSHDMALSWK
jgi:hypothetical protein